MANPFESSNVNVPSFSFTDSENVTGGIAGVIAGPTLVYRYLKSSPFTDIDVRDPVARKVQHIQSERFSTYVSRMKDIDWKTERQIRYNQYTGSGNYRQYTQGFDYLTDYHRLIAPYTSRTGLFKIGSMILMMYVVKKVMF